MLKGFFTVCGDRGSEPPWLFLLLCFSFYRSVPGSPGLVLAPWLPLRGFQAVPAREPRSKCEEQAGLLPSARGKGKKELLLPAELKYRAGWHQLPGPLPASSLESRARGHQAVPGGQPAAHREPASCLTSPPVRRCLSLPFWRLHEWSVRWGLNCGGALGSPRHGRCSRPDPRCPGER